MLLDNSIRLLSQAVSDLLNKKARIHLRALLEFSQVYARLPKFGATTDQKLYAMEP
jgi:hypothetical protein